MRLTDFTDHSLRVLLYVAAHDDRLATIAEIQEVFGASRGHLMKVVHLLSKAGYVDAIRGKSGGLRLGKKPEQINLGQLVRLTEPDFKLVECFGPKNRCLISQFCKLPGPLNDALTAFLETLDRHTLRDMMLPAQDYVVGKNTKFPQRGPDIIPQSS